MSSVYAALVAEQLFVGAADLRAWFCHDLGPGVTVTCRILALDFLGQSDRRSRSMGWCHIGMSDLWLR